MWKRSILILALCLGSSWAVAQNNNASSSPGYFDFGRIPGVVDEPKVQIDLNPIMLGFMAGALKEKNAESASVLEGIRGIKVFVYELTQGRDQVRSFIDDIGNRLEGESWMRMIYVDSEDSKVRIHVRPGVNGASISGMTLMVLSDDDDAVFMNIVGDINPSKLGQIASSVGFKNLLDDLSDAAEEVGVQ